VWARASVACAVISLGGCAGGSVATTPSQATPIAIMPPQIAPTSIALANPAPGTPLVVNISVASGSATMTFPAGTVFPPGASLQIQSVATSSGTTQAQRRANGIALVSVTPTTVSASLLFGNGLTITPNALPISAALTFTAGAAGGPQGGNTVAVSNTGQVNVVQTAATIVTTSIKATEPTKQSSGNAELVVNTDTVNQTIMVPLQPNATTTLVFGPASSFMQTTPYVTTTTTTTAQLPLLPLAPIVYMFPPIVAVFNGSVTIPAGTPNASFAATFGTDLPGGLATVTSLRRGRENIGGTFRTISFVSLTSAAEFTAASTPSFTFLYPPGSTLGGGESLYLALFDPTQPASGWTVFSGPATINDLAVTFPSTAISTTLHAKTPYTYALVSTAQALVAPTPAPTIAPSPVPTASPAPSPNPTPAPVPTATPGLP
jgi:hypothetical protein